MSQKTTLNKISKFENKIVEIQGWIYNKRSSGSIIFLQIHDGTSTIQGIIEKKQIGEKQFGELKELNLQSSIVVTGEVKKDKRAPTGYELQVKKAEIIQNADLDYPISKKEHGVGFLLDNRHLWLRSKRQQYILQIRDEIFRAITDFYHQNDYIRLDTPIITPNACEGTTTLFDIDYFGDKAYLSQSGQLYLEAAIFSLRKVYDFAPVFRAEKSKTRRHLIEFWMNNAEAAFVEHKENMEIQENLVCFVMERVLKECSEKLEFLGRDLKKLENIKKPFIRMTHKEAVNELQKLGSDMKHGEDFGADDETLLTKQHDKPIFIEYYPADVKAFYMKKHPTDKKLVLCNDMLAPEGYGEVIGGSQRMDSYDNLLTAVKKHKLSIKDFSWYLDLRKYGSVPHSGYGIGMERLLAWVCGLKHVRETIPFPRMLNRCYP